MDTCVHGLCTTGTRVEIQEEIIDWMLSETNQNVFWLHGVAGSGKSTIVATLAQHLRGIYRLGGFLCFKKEKSDPNTIIHTLAFELSSFTSAIQSLVLVEIKRNKDIIMAPLATQFDKLVTMPLTSVADEQLGPIAIILDGLDECGTLETRQDLMKVLHQKISALPRNFKFIIASRREPDIDKVFSSQPETVHSLKLDHSLDFST